MPCWCLGTTCGRVTEMRRIAHVFLMAVVTRESLHWETRGQGRNGGRLDPTASISSRSQPPDIIVKFRKKGKIRCDTVISRHTSYEVYMS